VRAWEARAAQLLARADVDRNASVREAGALLDALLALSAQCSRDATPAGA
jgi:hypothetical protein